MTAASPGPPPDLPGLLRDAWGVPHLSAGSLTELARLQGRVCAWDRTWQLEVERLRGEGRLSSMVGQAGLVLDRFARQAQVLETGRAAYESLSEETRQFVDAYVEGVNVGLAEAPTPAELVALDARPGSWDPWTPLVVFHSQHILFASFPMKMWRRHAMDVLGEDAPRLFHYEGLAAAGSNAWAVGGGRTASGRPLVAGDPHRTYVSPNVYAQVRLRCPEVDVAGFAFPGVPGVQHFAQGESVAWAITNAQADYQDLYVERLERRGGVVWACGRPAESWTEPIPVRGAADEQVEVVVTGNGAVVIGGPDQGSGLALRTPSGVLEDLGFEALLPLLRARTADDVEAAFARWVEPVNNVVVADHDGSVRLFVAGRVPRRHEDNRWLPVPGDSDLHTWQGWEVDLPRTEVGPEGQVVTANDRFGAGYERIGVEFAPPGRAERIAELLTGRSGLTVADFAAIHTDTLAHRPARLLEAVRGLADLEPASEALRRRLVAWDWRMEAGSAEAAAYDAVRTGFVRRLADALSARGLGQGTGLGAVFGPWLMVAHRVNLAVDTLAGVAEPFGLDSAGMLREAVAEAAAGEHGTWGDSHTYRPLHALAEVGVLAALPALASALDVGLVGLGGDYDCVLATGGLPGAGIASRGPVARYVWDLGDRSNSRWVVPMGASGDPASPHHSDQLAAYVAGRLLPVEP